MSGLLVVCNILLGGSNLFLIGLFISDKKFCVPCGFLSCVCSSCANRFSSSVQKSVLQMQANIDPDMSSVMSFCLQSGNGIRGFWIEPSRTRVGKHSRKVA